MDAPIDSGADHGEVVLPADEASPRAGRGFAAALGAAAVVCGLWYLVVLGTESPMMPTSLLLGWATGAALTRVTGRHGNTFGLYAMAITMTAMLVMLFFVNRFMLNQDPRNTIPAWANPTIVADVLRVGFNVWPLHYLWLIGAVAIATWRAIRGPHQPHPHVVRLFTEPPHDRQDEGR